MPYDQYAEVVSITGAQLEAALSYGADQIGRAGFPQISGLHMGVYNGRAYNVRINDSEIDPRATYRVATTDLVAGGGAGYPSFGSGTSRSYTGVRVRTLVERYLAGGTTASSRLSSRIQFLAQEPQLVAAAPVSEGPVEETGSPVNSGQLPADSGSEDMGARLDRNGQPMDTAPAVVEDEVLNDPSSGDAPPSESATTARDVTDEPAGPSPSESSVPDWNQPRTPGSLLGSSTASQDGLNYTFSLYKKENGHYMFVLEVVNQSGQPIDLNFETNERFDFRVSSGSNLRWNYNNNRFFVQSQQSETIDPGESGALEFSAKDWDGLDNTGAPLPNQTYRFDAVFLLSGSPVQLSFEAPLG
jgi:hypothetical protein